MGLKSFLESIAQPFLRSQDDRVALCHRVRIERETAPFLKENVRLPAPRSPISSQRLAILSLDVHLNTFSKELVPNTVYLPATRAEEATMQFLSTIACLTYRSIAPSIVASILVQTLMKSKHRGKISITHILARTRIEFARNKSSLEFMSLVNEEVTMITSSGLHVSATYESLMTHAGNPRGHHLLDKKIDHSSQGCITRLEELCNTKEDLCNFG